MAAAATTAVADKEDARPIPFSAIMPGLTRQSIILG
jgi:hypothetical protein